MIKRYRKPSESTKRNTMIEAKEIVMARQDTDLIDNILASTEITETFKAKREIESKVNFIRKHIEEQTDRKRYKDLVNFFVDKELYQINNRANFNRAGQDYSLSDSKGLAWTRFFNEKEKEVREDDIVVTSVLGGSFPQGILLGQLKNIEKQASAPFQRAEILPFFNLQNLNYVFIIKNFETL